MKEPFYVVRRVNYDLSSQALSDEELTRYFLDNGADPNARSSVLDITPLSTAIASAPLSTILLLLKNGGSVHSGQLLHFATQRESEDRVDILRILLQKGCGNKLNTLLYSDHEQSLQMMYDTPRGTPLHGAAQKGFTDVVQFLLENGSDPSIKDTRGKSALKWAEYEDCHDVVDILKRVTPVDD